MLIAAVRAAALVFVVQETESVVEAEPLEEETVSQEAVLVTIHAAAGLTVSWKVVCPAVEKAWAALGEMVTEAATPVAPA
jgi:hypothetical protein